MSKYIVRALYVSDYSPKPNDYYYICTREDGSRSDSCQILDATRFKCRRKAIEALKWWKSYSISRRISLTDFTIIKL